MVDTWYEHSSSALGAGFGLPCWATPDRWPVATLTSIATCRGPLIDDAPHARRGQRFALWRPLGQNTSRTDCEICGEQDPGLRAPNIGDTFLTVGPGIWRIVPKSQIIWTGRVAEHRKREQVPSPKANVTVTVPEHPDKSRVVERTEKL